MKILNKDATLKFKISETFEAGIVLFGSEVKAVKESHADLAGSHVKIINGEGYLINAKIYPYKNARLDGYDEARSRKLLLHKKELTVLKSKLEQGNLTIIPISLYTKNNLIKLELGLASGKKQYDHRATIKKKQQERDAEREMKKYIR